MTTDILEINDFIVLIDTTDAQEAEVSKCTFDNDLIGITFYGSGNVDITANYGDSAYKLKSCKGTALSFFGKDDVQFSHHISQSEPLKSVSIFSTIENIRKLPSPEKELFEQHLNALLTSINNFEVGPRLFMTPEMHTAIAKIFQTSFQGSTRLLFMKSQVLELLAHYFNQIVATNSKEIKQEEIEQMYHAKDIIIQNMEKPPSLSELSKLVGVNNNKLKKNFKQLFGVPVFKYLQNQRLQKAYHLLNEQEMTVKEVAWFVGYESLSSFSNAFHKQYGFRPSAIPK